jgi:hypothetical protein
MFNRYMRRMVLVGFLTMLLGAVGIALEIGFRPSVGRDMPLGMWALVAGGACLCVGIMAREWRLLLGFEEDDE